MMDGGEIIFGIVLVMVVVGFSYWLMKTSDQIMDNHHSFLVKHYSLLEKHYSYHKNRAKKEREAMMLKHTITEIRQTRRSKTMLSGTEVRDFRATHKLSRLKFYSEAGMSPCRGRRFEHDQILQTGKEDTAMVRLMREIINKKLNENEEESDDK